MAEAPDAVGLSSLTPADNLQIFIEGLSALDQLCAQVCEHTDALCDTRGLCSHWEDQTDTLESRGLVDP